ncbi:MAG: hypothetical protein QW835_06560 [Candidatus Hadarchaeum sp.]|uniref:hypothetical protein n=1 Tax=Candidatus Hadarchaeum sp. TaxID=2883567 RepID=UPI00316F319D
MRLSWPPQRLRGRSLVAIPLIVSAIFLLAILVLGLPLGRDFNGGTLVMVRGLDKVPDFGQLESQIDRLAGLETVVRAAGDGFDIEMDAQVVGLENEIRALLLDSFGIPSSSIVIGELGPVVSSAQCFQIIALGLGALILVGVVTFIFRRRVAAVTSVVVAVLDVVGVLGLMAILRVPINLASIFGILIVFVYVVEVNVFLGYRLLKGAVGDLKENISEAMRADLTLSAIASVVLLSVSFIVTAVSVREFALALAFGVAVNVFNVWFLGIALYLRHIERKKVVSYHVSI